MAWRTAPGSVCPRLGVSMEDPGRGDPHQHLRPAVSQTVAESDAVLASVEDKEWDIPIIGQQVDETLHLFDGGEEGID